MENIEDRLAKLELRSRRQTLAMGAMIAGFAVVLTAGWVGRAPEVVASTVYADRIVASDIEVVNASNQKFIHLGADASGVNEIALSASGGAPAKIRLTSRAEGNLIEVKDPANKYVASMTASATSQGPDCGFGVGELTGEAYMLALGIDVAGQKPFVQIVDREGKKLLDVITQQGYAQVITYENDRKRLELRGGPTAGVSLLGPSDARMFELGGDPTLNTYLTLYQHGRRRISLDAEVGPTISMFRDEGTDKIFEAKSQAGMGVVTMFKGGQPTISLTGTSTFSGMITTHDARGHVLTKLAQGGSGGGTLDIMSAQGATIHGLRGTADGDGIQFIQNKIGQPLVILGSATVTQGAVNVIKDRKVEWSMPAAFSFGG